MSDLEAKAFKVALLWEKTVKQELPGYNHTRLKKGDPRKGSLFRYCYKLVRETEGLLESYEYKLYITAQLHVLKNIKDQTGVHALIDCNCLVGDKAWKRWKMWESHYKRRIIQPKDSEDLNITATKSRIVEELNRTKKFLLEQFKHYPTADEYKPLVFDHTLIRWLTLGKLSPYYALLSPHLTKCLGGKTVEEAFMFDLGVYKRSLTPEIETYFEEEFSEEFS